MTINYSNIGLAYAAGFVIIGQNNIISEIKKKKIKVVVITSDTSQGTIRNLSAKCSNNDVDLITIDDNSEKLSKSLGKNGVQVIGITSRKFSKIIINERN